MSVKRDSSDDFYSMLWALRHEAAADAVKRAKETLKRARQNQVALRKEETRCPTIPPWALSDVISNLIKVGAI